MSCNTNSENAVTNDNSNQFSLRWCTALLYSANEQTASALFTHSVSLKPRYMFDTNTVDNKP